MNIYDFAKKIESKKDFVTFLNLLREDYNSKQSTWDNNTLVLFLEGMEGYVLDKGGDPSPDWKLFAEILLAAKVYE